MIKDKLYKCPYCDSKFTKSELIDHIGDKHDDLIPKNYSAFRVAYDNINHITGDISKKCIICNKAVDWNDNKGKYNIVCKSKKCKEDYIKSLVMKEAGIKDENTFNYVMPNFNYKEYYVFNEMMIDLDKTLMELLI